MNLAKYMDLYYTCIYVHVGSIYIDLAHILKTTEWPINGSQAIQA